MIKISPEDTYRKHSFLLMRDGSVVRGQIIRQDSSLVTVRVRGELSFIEADQILRISANRPGDIPLPADAQTTPITYTVFVFKDGTQVEGKYVRRDSTMITVRKRNGQLTYFEPELLQRIDTIRTTYSGVSASSGLGFTNRFSPWLLTGLTAYTAEKGRFYYRNTLGLINEFDFGITRHWSVGASFVTPVPYLVYTDLFVFNGFLANTTKLFSTFSVPIGDRFRFGLNAQYQDLPFTGNFRRGPLTFQALASIGTPQRNVTLGYGLVNRGALRIMQNYGPYGYTYTDVPTTSQSFLTLGIMQKVGPLLTLISDNRINLGKFLYYDSDRIERASVSFALRLDRRRHAFDLGAYGLIYRDKYTWNDHQVRVLPYIGYNLIIGRD
ncbi:hypothetical protein GCM10028773_07410 [Spirosoma koreense]